MKVLWKLPDVERTWYSRGWNDEIKIWKSTRWYIGPKQNKWWLHPNVRALYCDCPTRGTHPFTTIFDLPVCYNDTCHWSSGLGKWRHKNTQRSAHVDVAWVCQQTGLCIERNLTSWVFRWRYRRTKAAIKIQRWYKGMYYFRCYKRAKAHFNSYLDYEPKPTSIVQDPNREAGNSPGSVLDGNPRTPE